MTSGSKSTRIDRLDHAHAHAHASRSSQPPMIRSTLGSFSLGTLALCIGALGAGTADMAVVGYWAMIAGLCFGSMAIIALLLDSSQSSRQRGLPRPSIWQVLLLIIGAVLFAVSAVLQNADYRHAVISSTALSAAILGIIALLGSVWAGSSQAATLSLHEHIH